MHVFKTRDDRFNQVLDFVGSVFPGQHGTYCRQIVEARIDALSSAEKKQIGDVLDIPSSVTPSNRRNAMRAVLFLRFAVSRQPVGLANSYKAELQHLPINVLTQKVQGLIPLQHDSPNRSFWNPSHFTKPTQSGPAPNGFKFIVFGLNNTNPPYGVKYSDIINNPNQIRTWMISTSVIDEQRVATYYPYGLILKVPESCVLTTSARDQGFTNYPKQVDTTKANWQNMDPVVHVREVLAGNPILLTPDQVLNGARNGVSSGKYGYNEVTVLGTAPDGKRVKAQAFFMKVDSQGNRFEFKAGEGPKGPFVTDQILQLLKTSGLPIVEVTDTSGKNG